jgi:hypothetical protein
MEFLLVSRAGRAAPGDMVRLETWMNRARAATTSR